MEPPSAIDTMRQAFVVDLSEQYAAERTFAAAMPEMFNMAHSQPVKQALQQHIADTQQQIDNLDRALTLLGARPVAIPCRAAMGLIEDFRAKAQQIQVPQLMDGCIVAANVKVEHMEMAAYRPLVEKAGMMGQAELQQLLQQNLAMEERFAQTLEQIEHQLGQQVMSQHPELVGTR